MFAETATPEITGVLDWETAMLGDPLTEVGYLLLRWRDDGDPTPNLDVLEARYSTEDALRAIRAMNEHGLAPYSTKPGSPSRATLLDRYENRVGLTVEDERFYRVHAAFMLATVWADLHRYAVKAGEDSDWEPSIEYMSLLATAIADEDCC